MNSREIYELRREGNLLEAYNLANSIIHQEGEDDDLNKALAWTLIDICKENIQQNKVDIAIKFFDILQNIHFDYSDSFVETIENQIAFIRKKVDVQYGLIEKADNLSKSGRYLEGYQQLKSLFSQEKLSPIHHETYGWAIYRYLKADSEKLSSIQVRTLLRDYMLLKNERPSMLHSTMLNFALNYSKINSEFNFLNFFKLWDPQNLRVEDLNESRNADKTFPSLLSRICKDFVNRNETFDLEDILLKDRGNHRTKIIDYFREQYFWNIFNAHKEGNLDKTWQLFSSYNRDYAQYGPSHWHSEVLSIAERFMQTNDQWRFSAFFKAWSPENLLNSDWEEKVVEDKTYKCLAKKAIKKAYEIEKTKDNSEDLGWLSKVYDTALAKFPSDEWLFRQKATLLLKQGNIKEAEVIYKKIILDLSDKYYIWQEYANCFENNLELKIAMLCKALTIEKNEDYIGDLHLDLAKLLASSNLPEKAAVELKKYSDHRVEKKWPLSGKYEQIRQSINYTGSIIGDNFPFYETRAGVAEDFVFDEVPFIPMVIIDIWKDNKQRNRIKVSDGDKLEFQLSMNRFKQLRNVTVGDVIDIRVHTKVTFLDTPSAEDHDIFSLYQSKKQDVTEEKFIVLQANRTELAKWSVLKQTYAIVDYINVEKNILHILTKGNNEVFIKKEDEDLQRGDFVSAKFYYTKIKDEQRLFLVDMTKVSPDAALPKFNTYTAVVDDVNPTKNLFHFVINSKLQGIVYFDNVTTVPDLGDLLAVTVIHKKSNNRLIVLLVEPSQKETSPLKKVVKGTLCPKYKTDFGVFDFDVLKDHSLDYNVGRNQPDFGFINDYYVPKKLLVENRIIAETEVVATIVYAGDKWKTVKIEIVEE